MALILDEAWARVNPVDAAHWGYSGVIGYVSQDTTGKNITRAEVDAVHAAGLDVGLVYEYDPMASTRGAMGGYRDGQIARDHAQALGAPPETTLYCAVDWDVPTSGMGNVSAYVRAFRDAVHAYGYRAGVYGSYAVCVAVRSADLGVMLWQTYAWSNGQWCPDVFVRQTANGIHVGGADVDRDETMVADWGQWPAVGAPGQMTTGVEMTPEQVQQLQDVWDWSAAMVDPNGNPPTRSRFNWPALKFASRLDRIDSALASLASAVASMPAVPSDVAADLHTIAEDMRKLTG